MNKERDIKDLYLIMGFLQGLSVALDDCYEEESCISREIEYIRVTLGNIISHIENGYDE